MSYILDALKKSDREYRLQQGQGGTDVSYAPIAGRPLQRSGLWLPLVCSLALLLAVAVLYLLLDSGRLPLSLTNAVVAAPVEDVSARGAASLAVAAELSGGDVRDGGQPVAADGAQGGALSLMPAALRRRLGPLRFSLHVYSADPQQRSIIINNRMMREGEWLNEELWLQAITEEGVVMALDDVYYRLPVVNDWQ